jgi:hypothetical protein
MKTSEPFGTSNLLTTLAGMGKKRSAALGNPVHVQPPGEFKICPLEKLRRAAPKRLPGYVEECLRRGRFDSGAQTVTLTMRDFMEIRAQFNLKTGRPQKIAPGCC